MTRPSKEEFEAVYTYFETELDLPAAYVGFIHGRWRIILDDGAKSWTAQYVDSLERDWKSDIDRFIARYHMCLRKHELWKKAESLGIQLEDRMAWVNETMTANGERISVAYVQLS